MKSKLFKKTVASVATLAMVAQLGFVLPASAETTNLYSQDYESIADTDALKNGGGWKSENYLDGVTLGTDNSKYVQYTVGSQNTRSATSDFEVSLADYDEYAVEFDLALTKSNKENVQFVVATGTKPTKNVGMDSDYIFKIDMAGNTTNCTINDVEAATVTLEDSKWYHYCILVDKTQSLATVNILDGDEKVVDKLLVPVRGAQDKITGILFLSGRYNSVMKLDNIVVRTTDDNDEFAEKGEETLSKVEFVSEINEKITQPSEDAPVSKPVTIKATGIYGGDLTDACEYEWSVTGLDNEDGYISLTKETGTGLGTEGEAPDGATAYFNVRNGVSNWFGKVNVKVKYLDDEISISTPFAVIGASGESNNLAPSLGYPVEMNEYDDALVGYAATSNGVNTQDIVLNNWSIYGSNGSRTLTLNKDEDGTKYLRFASNGGGGSTVGVYQLGDQSEQYIIDMKVRFTGGSMAFGHYYNTANNGDSNPSWTASYGSGALTVGTQSITGLNASDWYRVVISADESVGTYWAKVYTAGGELVGETDPESLNTALQTNNKGATVEGGLMAYKLSQKYFCFQGTYPVDLASFKIYYPTISSISVNSEMDTISVPTGVEDEDSSLNSDGTIKYNAVTKKATVTVNDVTEASLIVAEYAKGNTLSNISVTPITFTDGAAVVEDFELPSGCKLFVWNGFESIKPLVETAGEYEAAVDSVVMDLTAVIKDTDGFEVTGNVTWDIDVDDEAVTLEETGAQKAKLTISKGAPAGAVTITARKGSASVEKVINLTTTGNTITFTKSTASLTIPFTGEEAVSADFEAQTTDKDGNKVEYALDKDGNATQTPAAVTLTVLDKNLNDITANMPTGIAFDAQTGKLTVSDTAKSNVIYIKATNNDEIPLSRTVMVNIHGLSFAFGSDAPADDSYTQVTSANAYSEKLGYGFADASVVTDAAVNVTGTADYRFKVKVPNGNYVVNVNTSAESVTSEVVESVSATTGISKSGASFKVAVCDEVLDLTFPSGATLSSIAITQDTAKTAQEKPSVYAIGDSTTNNTGNGAKSWGNCVNGGVVLPNSFSSFSNNGMAGRDSVSFYNQGRVETVLLSVCPGDYVTVNMGINSKETNEGASYSTLLDEYYVQGIIQRGGIPVIVTATPQGPVGSYTGNYNSSTGVFTCNRGTGARNGVLRSIAQKYNLNIIELGYYFDEYFNDINDEYLAAYNAENSTSYTTVLELVQSWYVDHNHYKEPLGNVIGQYILDCLAEIAGGSTDFNHANDPHINER